MGRAISQGTGSFDNDDANAWLARLNACTGLSFVCKTLADVLQPGSGPTPLQWRQAVAAVEIVLVMLQRPTAASAALQSVLHPLAWLRTPPEPALVLRALQVVDQLAHEHNPLHVFWQRPGADVQWMAAASELRAGLQG